MGTSPNERAIEEAIRQTIEANASMVQNWIANEPGSWGFLAAKAVVAYRQTLGRTLTNGERREVWYLLWQNLLELKR